MTKGDGARGLARLTEDWGRPCLAAWGEVISLDSTRRRGVVLSLSQRLFSPLPRGIERIHPSWLQPLVDGEPPEIAELLSQALPAELLAQLQIHRPPSRRSHLPPALRPFLLRQILKPLQSMPSARTVGASLERLEDLVHWPEPRLRQALLHLGCLIAASLMQRPEAKGLWKIEVPPSYASKINRAPAVGKPIPSESLRPPEISPPSFEALLLDLVSQLIGPALGSELQRQVAQRLPRELGQYLLQPATASISDGPARSLLRYADEWARMEAS
jgi:hypothetical protein